MGHGGAYVERVAPEVHARRQAVAPLPWTWLRQVHGRRVLRVTTPGEHAGERADAAISTDPGCALAVLGADCAPVLFAGDGAIGAAHVGWRGLRDGVLDATVDALRAAGAGPLRAVIGPCIHAECYEFGAEDLASVVAAVGAAAGVTAAGAPALDLPGGIRAALERAGIDVVDVGACTACRADAYYSYRARREFGRQAGVIWLPADAA